jgi:hypothetical protein
VLGAPLPIRLFEWTIREPNLMYFAPGSEPKDHRGYPSRVDLAMEVVSEGAEAHCITVLVLDSSSYRVHGEFRVGQVASGVLLPSLAIEVAQVVKLAQGP